MRGPCGEEGGADLLVSIWAEAEETMLPSWYATPGKVARKARGDISASWIGICERSASQDGILIWNVSSTHNTPCTLHTELYAEGTSRECAERGRKNPQRDERANEHDEDDDGESSAYVLREPASDSSATRPRHQQSSNTANRQATHAIAPQLPMIVATVESCALKPFVVCRYVGYRSCEPCERKLNPVMSTTA